MGCLTGGDGIPGNDFSGHFCIHFRGSTTHKSDAVDLAHQLMVHKAAGKLVPYLESLNPDELAAALIEALGQQDTAIEAAASQGLSKEGREWVSGQMESITAVKLDKHEPSARADGELEHEAEWTALVSRSGRKPTKETFRFSLARESVEAPWRITDIRIGR